MKTGTYVILGAKQADSFKHEKLGLAINSPQGALKQVTPKYIGI
jgi:hypothetical protein